MTDTYEFVLGLIAGLVVSFAGHAIMESVKNSQYKKSIKQTIKAELENLSSFMGRFLEQTDTTHNSLVKIQTKPLLDEANIMLSGIIPRIPYAHFSIFNYNAIPSEMKIKTFDGETLIELERVFQKIKNYGVLVEFPFYSTLKNDLMNLKKEIDIFLQKLS